MDKCINSQGKGGTQASVEAVHYVVQFSTLSEKRIRENIKIKLVLNATKCF